jgi:hypothetical protein
VNEIRKPHEKDQRKVREKEDEDGDDCDIENYKRLEKRKSKEE